MFSGLSGYNDVQAKKEYKDFLEGIEGRRALHLCANVNLPYLLELGIEIISFDAYQIEFMPKEYASAVAKFLRGGGVISWGIVPTDLSGLSQETPEMLARRLSTYWEVVSKSSGLSLKQIAEQALVAPARCCLKNIGQVGAVEDTRGAKVGDVPISNVEERLVEKAFDYLRTLSGILRDKFGL